MKTNGYLLLVLPNKIGNFDHKRKYTTFEHILNDYKIDVDESDTTHINEYIEFFDLEKKPGNKISVIIDVQDPEGKIC